MSVLMGAPLFAMTIDWGIVEVLPWAAEKASEVEVVMERNA